MSKKDYKIVLRWAEKNGTEYAGEEEINMTDEELAKLLGIRARYPGFIGGAMPLHIIYLDRIQSVVKHKIDINKHDYEISSLSIV